MRGATGEQGGLGVVEEGGAMGGGLVQIHNVVGTLVVVAFLILTILNGLRVAGR